MLARGLSLSWPATGLQLPIALRAHQPYMKIRHGVENSLSHGERVGVRGNGQGASTNYFSQNLDPM